MMPKKTSIPHEFVSDCRRSRKSSAVLIYDASTISSHLPQHFRVPMSSSSRLRLSSHTKALAPVPSLAAFAATARRAGSEKRSLGLSSSASHIKNSDKNVDSWEPYTPQARRGCSIQMAGVINQELIHYCKQHGTITVSTLFNCYIWVSSR